VVYSVEVAGEPELLRDPQTSALLKWAE